MTSIEIEAELTDEERAIRDTVHKFAEEVMRPVGEQLDKLPDPNDVSAKDSILWDFFKKQRELGLDMLSDPSGDFTPVQQARLRSIVGEEQGWGDSGLSISLGVAGFPRMMATMSGKPALIERFGRPESIGCWAITEPDHGSDQILYGAEQDPDRLGRPNCIAKKEGDDFVVTGQKAAWVSNGTIADAAALFCAVDMGTGSLGMAAFVAPLDERGVSRGKALDKIGQRALDQGEIFFDGLRIPADNMVVPPEAYGLMSNIVLTTANTGMGSTFIGVAQAALDHAVNYAKERIQGGVPIIEHQGVKLRLFEMFRKVEAARGLNRRVAIYNATNPPGRLEYAIASKVTSTNTAFEVASEAVGIYGGNGLSREYPVEKLMRDARASMIEDGCNEVLALAAAERL